MKRLTMIKGLLLVVCLLVPVSCAKAPVPALMPTPAPKVVPTPTPRPTPTPAPSIEVPPPAPSPYPTKIPPPVPPPPVPPLREGVVEVSVGGQPWAERMIVRTGDMRLVVNDVPIALDQITELAEDFDGYVVSSKRWEEGERLVGRIAIRVPAEDFGDVMEALRELAVDVTSEDTSSKDVTEEYVDLSAKLKNLEATEEQYLRLMEKAEKVEVMLNVQRELSKTRGEIEQTKGRMQYLERTSATSLIQAHLEQAKLDVNFTADKARVKEGEKVWFSSQIAGGFAPYS